MLGSVTSSLVLACVLAVASRPSAASAQNESAHTAPVATPSSPWTLTIGSRQIEAFANLVDEPVETVTERLRQDPTLIPVVTEAADTRMNRKRSGKWTMVGGFSLYGLGTGAVVYGFVHHLGRQQIWCEGYSCPETPMSTQDQTLLIGGLAAAGVGLVLAIPGIVMAARQTDIETEAVNRYQHPQGLYESPFPPESTRLLPSGPGARGISISLLAFSF